MHPVAISCVLLLDFFQDPLQHLPPKVDEGHRSKRPRIDSEDELEQGEFSEASLL